jgi:hypothetical protein
MGSDSRDCVQAARSWILETALPHVPAALHESFLVQQPLHRELLAAAA